MGRRVRRTMPDGPRYVMGLPCTPRVAHNGACHTYGLTFPAGACTWQPAWV